MMCWTYTANIYIYIIYIIYILYIYNDMLNMLWGLHPVPEQDTRHWCADME